MTLLFSHWKLVSGYLGCCFFLKLIYLNLQGVGFRVKKKWSWLETLFLSKITENLTALYNKEWASCDSLAMNKGLGLNGTAICVMGQEEGMRAQRATTALHHSSETQKKASPSLPYFPLNEVQTRSKSVKCTLCWLSTLVICWALHFTLVQSLFSFP